MNSRERASIRATRIYGIAGLGVLAVIIGSAFASYGQFFTSALMVTVEADRAGLLLDKGSDVRVDGLTVGRVRSIDPSPGGVVRIKVALDPDQAEFIGEETTATIEATTTFGAKYVALHDWKRSGAVIEAGAVLQATGVATETNDLFAELEDVLSIVKPSELNAMLTGLSRALEGRGDQPGDMIETGHRYLTDFEAVYPALDAGLERLPEVIGSYADMAPGLLKAGSNFAVTSRTLSERDAQLRRTLLGISHASQAGTRLVGAIDKEAGGALNLLRPVTAMHAEFSPIYPCLLNGIDKHQREVNKALGTAQPGYQGVLSFLPSQRPYTFERDLPKLMPIAKPSCRSLPDMNQARPKRHVFDDGTNVFDNSPDLTINPRPITIYEQLFGDAKGGEQRSVTWSKSGRSSS